MKIAETDINIVYPQIKDYKKNFVLHEDVLSEEFNSATILAIPDGVQAEVPRIVTQSKHGHSILNVALTVTSLITQYSDRYTTDWNLCRKYISERCGSVYKIVDQLTGNKESYVGIISKIAYDNLSKDSLEILKTSLIKDSARLLGSPFDISCKLTYTYANRYYINITLENIRQYNIEALQKMPVENSGFIGITLDVNDRYAANLDKEYVSGKEAFDSILEITSNIITNKLDDLIMKGEFTYDLGITK